MSNFWDDAEIISTYTREQAIEDGMLIDVSTVAAECGFRFPVALTADAWAEGVALRKGYRGCQSEDGRLWDVLWMCFCQIRRSRGGDTIAFRVKVSNRWKFFKAVCGPGDNAEPVITIMTPNED